MTGEPFHPSVRVPPGSPDAPEQRSSSDVVFRPYKEGDRDLWNRFVDGSKNGTFLHRRDFMEYHADRFHDASLMVFTGDERLLAVLPCHREGDRLVSHGGLTYGGVVTDEKMTGGRMVTLFEQLRVYMLDQGVRHVSYKAIPHIYHRLPAEEDLYALFRVGARLHRRDLLTVVKIAHAPRFRAGRRDGIRKARRARLEVRESRDLRGFWALLEEQLLARHGVVPVHSLEEIQALAERFPDCVRQHGIYEEGALLCGCTMFVSAQVAHVQYIANGQRGRMLGALDLLFDELIHRTYAAFRYFDFGSSTLDQGRGLNEGLAFQKEGFGGRSVAHDFYEWDLLDGG